jgi:hypothetical protein
MAAGQSNSGIFYGISNGKITRQFANKTANSIERANKNSKVVHEEFYDFLDGVITSITTKEHADYGKFWVVNLKDVETGQDQILQFNYSSGYANGFLKALPNVDLSSKVKLSPSAKVEDGKTKTTLFINQHGKAIKWYYTKETPNGIPELKQQKVKGKITWDDSDIMEFLENMVKTDIQPLLSKTAAPAMAGSEDEETPF